jgi:hypothetical protein
MQRTPLDNKELLDVKEALSNEMNSIALNSVYTTSNTGPYINPYSYVPSPGSVVQWTNYNTGSPTKEDTEEAEVLNTKKFKLIAEEFCKRNVEWNTVPDINQPLRKIRIMHSSKQLWIQDCFPMNEIKVVGGTMKPRDMCDPLQQIGLEFPVHSMLLFERWAFGIEECPYGK